MGINKEQALDCLRSADLIGIGMEADAVRRGIHPEGVVSYAVDCMVSAGAEVAEEMQTSGANWVRLEAPGLNLAEFTEALSSVQSRFPGMRVQGPSGSEILKLADAAGLGVREAVARLREAGLRSFTGDDLQIGASERLFELHRQAHLAGIRTTAGMIFGAGESLEQRVDHLFAIREIQEETGGFTAFSPWSFKPGAASGVEAPTAVEYMRTLAVSRIVLDNIENVESNCVAQGLKVVQMALRFGANDAGAVRDSGSANFTEEDLRRVIRDAGFRPVERDTLYETMFLNN